MSNNSQSIIIESCVKLDQAQLRAITSAFGVSNSEHSIDSRIVPSLIAGIRVRYQGKTIDMSFDTQLHQLHQNMTNYDK